MTKTIDLPLEVEILLPTETYGNVKVRLDLAQVDNWLTDKENIDALIKKAKYIKEQTKKENAKSVTKVHLKIGQLIGVKEDSFKETFSVLAKGTMLEKAKLELTFFPGTRIEVVSFDVE